MSILRLTEENFQSYTLNANPIREFSSSSSGITGSISLFSDNSSSTKDIFLRKSAFIDNSLELKRQQIAKNISYGGLDSYLGVEGDIKEDTVNGCPQGSRQTKKISIKRIEPGKVSDLDSTHIKKLIIKNNLFPFYKNKYRNINWAYTNYHSLNFVTGGDLQKNSVLIYPSPTGSFTGVNLINKLAPSSSFTFDFYVNPRYSNISSNQSFTAGTILHMSSCYAVSLVTGTSVGINGLSDGFRILLQLSQSSEIPPSQITINGNTLSSNYGGIKSNLCYISSDNSLKLNNWHHVAIRWDGDNYSSRDGNIIIDGNVDTTFSIPSSSIMQSISPNYSLKADPNALFVGNFYEGNNFGSNEIIKFFNTSSNLDEGVTLLSNSSTDPSSFSLNHPLNAELHDIKLYKSYRNIQQIVTGSQKGSSLESDLIFYLPPFFIKETRTRKLAQFYSYIGTTPVPTNLYGKTEDPFDLILSFALAARKINLENFTKDFVNNEFPRLYNLTASNYGTTKITNLNATEQLYLSSSFRKANITLLPCDNGKFVPNFGLLDGNNDQTSQFINSFGEKSLSLINLDNLVSTEEITFYVDPNKYLNPSSLNLISQNATKDNPIFNSSPFITSSWDILNATRDPSSNEVTIFDISNLFYGDKINPGSFVIQDLAVTGSSGRMTFTLKDDEYGNLYRADSLTENCKWSSVGNILYDEGLVIVKSPNLPYFGKNSFKISFEGERKIYVFEVSIPVPEGLFNSSSNPSYIELVPSDYANETSNKFTYLTNVNLHDDNLNVIMKANLSQPIIKKEREKLLIKLRVDF